MAFQYPASGLYTGFYTGYRAPYEYYGGVIDRDLTPEQWSAQRGEFPPPEYMGVVPPKEFYLTGIMHYDPTSQLALQLNGDVYTYSWYHWTPPADETKEE